MQLYRSRQQLWRVALYLGLYFALMLLIKMSSELALRDVWKWGIQFSIFLLLAHVTNHIDRRLTEWEQRDRAAAEARKSPES